MASETMTRGALPRIQWSPVIAGVLCALAVHVTLGLFGTAFGLAADPADSKAVGFGAGLWGLAVPFLASALGAYLCVRMARETEDAGSYLHGGLVWCIGLIAGALFITGSMATSAMTSATAASGNVRGGFSRMDAEGSRGAANEAAAEDAQKGAAAAAGAGGLGALLGLAGAFVGAAAGRRALSGRSLRSSVGGWRLVRHDASRRREAYAARGVAKFVFSWWRVIVLSAG
jgi:hypothetical protein